MYDSLPRRALGATGVQVTQMGMGGGHFAGRNPVDADAVRVVQAAIDHGIRFVDTAWDYGLGRSEELIGQAIHSQRSDVFLMTKVCARDRAGALTNLEDSLRRLRTEVIDLWQFHEINYATDDELILAADGAAEAAQQALRDGKVRFVGVHRSQGPDYLLAMLGHEFPWSTVQMPVTVLDTHYKSFIKKVLPEAQRRNVGVIGMKALGGRGQFLTHAGVTLAECLRFALSQPISTLVSGITTLEEVAQNTAVARDFVPMTAAEQEQLLARVRAVAADGRFEYYKSTQHFDSPVHREQHNFTDPAGSPHELPSQQAP
jgi:aryl-alcohol dehydrogenase-like predicted oxidoreductase